ncbi:uncharacterized protein MYU51_009831 [Penicillium brevicompactum]|uniref:uncharacterized protein n=1 Tax=Penicillium brevicompactum TaxID=5074 RepID=UPI00253FAAEA|nr:uncharacterized protein N7506_001044 [Penicillium brevicompactum]KAJ5347791.1 hypothetical protein N7506_001044 [Penicillium brevicompactum]
MERNRYPLLLSALVALVCPSTAIYSPTSVFLSPQHNDSLAYILRPGATGTEFLSLNLSSSINADDLSYNTLLSSAPFHTDHNSTAISTIDDHSRITVYAGSCGSATDHQALWQFRPDTNSSTGNGTWTKLQINSDGKTAPNYLAAGFSYSSSHGKESSMYAFGGMCPFANSTDDTWIEAANYSQSTVVLGQSPYYSNKYTAATTGNRAPPVAEAGMAVVPLEATYSAELIVKQQDFLFIGGHTRQAFLNMSQLAIFSVPQQSWSFVSAGGKLTKSELAVRDWTDVEPRSGHTAVLSGNGRKIFVFGGWVGDTSVAADPQFAVLELDEGFGGAAEWTWTTPSPDGLGIDEGSGIFGHGAAMLPGDVMMISGGYNIAKQSSKRAVAATSNSQVYLYNVSSNSWSGSYHNPAAISEPASSSNSKALSSSQKAGLGVGLGIGCPAAIAILLVAWNCHRKRCVKGKRDSQLRELALGAERAHFWGRGDPTQASSIRSSGMSEKRNSPAYPWSPNNNQSPTSDLQNRRGSAAERTGLLMDAPSPTKNNPPPANARPFPNRYSEYRRSDATDIHPIDEREEDEAVFRENLMATIPAISQTRPKSEPEDPFSDTPYATPRSTIFGVGLGPFYSRRKDIGQDSPESPTKSERTTTNLSDSSAFSYASSQPVGQVHQARAVVIQRPYSWGSERHSLENLAAASTHSDPDGVAPSENSSDSYSTAQTNMSHRQAENESLLFDPLDPSTPITNYESSSPSKLPRQKSRSSSGWMINTMRRALTMSRREAHGSSTDNGSASGIDRGSTLIGSEQDSPSSSVTPRRTVSASAELFRRKQGAKDWNAKRVSDDVFNTARSTRDDLFRDAPGYLGNDVLTDNEDDVHDWDLEGTAEGRRVQMTFTVPREKLRVVNATAGDMDNISERSASRPGSRRVST